MRESAIQREIIKWLRARNEVTLVARVNSGAKGGTVFNYWYPVIGALPESVTTNEFIRWKSKRKRKIGGFPDLLVLAVVVGAVFVECKAVGGKLQPTQMLFKQQAERTGVKVLVPENLGDFIEMWGDLIKRL